MFITLDIGGTKMRMASSFDGNNIHDELIIPTPQDVEIAIDQIKNFTIKNGGLNSETSICVGLPGVFDKEKSMLISAPNLNSWVSKKIKLMLENSIRTKNIYLENDCSLAGLGEAKYGAGKNYDIVAYLSFGTGVGGSRIVDEKIDRSVYGFEPGHQILNIGKTVDQKVIDLESLVGGVSLKIKYTTDPDKINDPNIWNEWMLNASVGISNLILFWSPDAVVLGGGIIRNNFINIDTLTKYVSERVKVFPVIPKIIKSELGDHSGLKGGFAYLKNLKLL
jgi:glucokinase